MTTRNQRTLDEHYMRTALSLALNGTASVSPNPRVGCVIVRDSAIIGSGWHRCCGEPHAEVEAVRNAGGDVRGATVYVNLEPCCHQGRTPPCAHMLIERGVSRVVVGMTDPNPKVDCMGERMLRDTGIEVTSGILEKESKWINRGFIRRMKMGRPWITLKTACSLDGNIALKDGSSKWITGEASRRKVHMMRAESDALLSGIGTVLGDDPAFTVREAEGRTPLRAILDRRLRTPLNASLFSEKGLIFFTGKDAPTKKIESIRALGAEVFIIDAPEEREPDYVMAKLCEIGVNYLMVECGAKLTASLLRRGLADEISLFMAPKLLGSGIRFTEHLKLDSLEDAITIKDMQISPCGEDIWIRGVLSCSPDL
ncbi:MAG TPA: bifunctional diaminohydroxyphosphoribosylaminopyrimidine deaminase/5-amino-6-(5-phosphoribosylamino)uracil reductase RibD [Synergistaceae bacterium]|jgi:diaminohydroxyphosphoribosylaminopyrimidine deaminase/5-amino-6-(5-phosphoribosylamino)uracil reductase|uniref:bifunctional diaminohydroxyphosphoribosylaminopyrimidine deaminase/5-amino-6-(5-phosphoribosylamino)uracil reductase RibD n=1 Tax=Synergistaceae TaxID=649777 RepID=UPI000EE5FD85|nr:bifunctional diaminohydroxyphosphoribosylaminopyrimidine deaminase/5-amino-6-(5-phosphoribosylamino)uracil reductase RibD [Synergistaceae bacterium DZ-S4]HAH70050.1 bifunctional diaminohydroxyphosphoribosylaminopyrimidine deaminase/5-amino-6-(5-phosphoribosylamino)uracil reductase RibD [Synergistaceae bacterium]